ncbi:hypothetical protein ABT324_28780 [Saccharopolyspora sp. NPDC000359]|uniref:hypothetical protein n=1 Tax=Saccharopolyspora sp. NPDC000359 TaxID=3154251 RepID=UPI00331B9566
MTGSPLDLVLTAGWLTARIIFAGTLWLHLVSLGNPRVLHEDAKIFHYLNAAPPTVVFRWRKGIGGYEVVVYNAVTDEEEAKPALFQLDKWSPTYLLWRKRRPQPKNAMVRSVLLGFLLRLVFFICFFLGSFALVGWLAITEHPHWFVALVVLAVHQLAFARTNLRFVWLRWWLFVVIGLGVWVYLQGGVFETFAVCTVGALITLAVLGQWYLAVSPRFETMRRLEMGPFDPQRRRKPW